MNQTYSEILMNVLVHQSSNELFYTGNIDAGAKSVTKEVVDTIDADRASIWLFNHNRDSIILQQLYIKSDSTHYQDIVLHKSDFEQYFLSLEDDPIIVANDAETHEATSCFLESYLKPLGVKSMLDVPVWYKGSLIGVICIESLTSRNWKTEEIQFAQILSSLYSFAYSVKESTKLSKDMIEMEKFLDSSSIISKADNKGKITYVNKKFEEISKYSLDEVIGNDHNMVNSGIHPKEFWTDMYKTVIIDKSIWNDVCTNRAKDGSLYHVDTFIKGEFDSNDKFVGFMSIRQDVTDLKRKEMEISNRMDAINRSNAVIEFDLNGNIKFANDLFLTTMG